MKDYFKLSLPNSLQVETDKKNRLIGFGGNSPNDVPFLSIEFGERINTDQIIVSVNAAIKQFGKSLEKIKCSPTCQPDIEKCHIG